MCIRDSARADHLAHPLDVEIVLLGKGEGVGHTYHGARQGDLVGELSLIHI